MATQKSTSGINEALGITTRTINTRASRFRNFVIGVVVVALISMVWAGIQMSWQPLLGFLLLVPLCGTILYRDTCLVNQWQQQILEMWVQEGLNLDIFSNAMTTIRMLPSRTLQSMLGTLPTKENSLADSNISPGARKTVAMTLQTINRCQNDRTLFATLACTLGLASLGFAIVQWSWLSLLGLLLVPAVIGGGRWLSSSRFQHWKQQILEILQQQELEVKNFVEIANQLNWESIPDKKKDKLLYSLADGVKRKE